MLTIFLELLTVFIFFLLWVKSDQSPFVNKILKIYLHENEISDC